MISTVRTISSTAYEASHVLASRPVTVYGISGYNSKASAQFIQLHDATSLPSDTAVPVFTATVAASSNFSLAMTVKGLKFANGCVVCNSSTGPTLTIGGADLFITANVE